jgi:integrase
VYVLKYRLSGRQRFFTIGAHGSPWTPETARREARRLLGLVAAGTDPASARDQARGADTLAGIADAYLHAARERTRPKTFGEVSRYLLTSWAPLHPLPAREITRRDISARVAEIAGAQGAVTATRARAALSAMFNWAIRDGLDIPANPVSGTNRPPRAPSRDRVLTNAELRAIWLACDDDDYGRIVRLLILLGQRRNEVGGMRWSELTGDNWTLPAARTKNHREHLVPLSPLALALLPPHRNRDFLFGYGHGPTYRGYAGWVSAKSALDSRIAEQGAPLAPWVIHDIRRSVATGMAELGILPHIIEAALNHASGHKAGVAGVYNRARYVDETRAALTLWSDHLARLAHD